jgi:hypothetical protein
MGADAHQRGKAAGTSCSSLETDGGRDEEEEDSKPSPVTSSGTTALTGWGPCHQAVQEKPTPGQIPHGWTRVKLEQDC